MKWRFSCILLFFLAALFVTPIAVSEGIGTVYGESAGEVSSASYISISPGVSSAVSLEVSSEAIDFGRLA
jgi:hypothetical protein